MSATWPIRQFGEFLRPNSRPYELGSAEDANLVGMRWYGEGPFHRELKPALRIAKKSHFVIRAGDVIYNKLFAWKGAFGVVSAELDEMFVSDKFPTYQIDATIVDPRFLAWYFRLPRLWEQAQAMSTGSAAISKLTLNPPRFLELTMPVPELAEQRSIVSRLDAVASLAEKAIEIRRSTSRVASALLGSVLHRLNSEVASTGTLGTILVERPRNGWSARCDNVDGGTFVLSLSAVTGFSYRSSEFKRTSLPTIPNAHYWLRPGDLLITRSNTPELVGHAAIYDGSPAPCIYSDLMMRLNVRTDVAVTRFVWYWLQSPRVREFIMTRAKGTSPTMKKIAQGTVMSIPFPDTLTVVEQSEIVRRLDKVQSAIESLKQTQARGEDELRALISALLDKAFSQETTQSCGNLPVTEKKHSPTIYFKRAAIAAYIIDWLHTRPTFGRVQLEKCLYLSEAYVGVDLEGEFKRAAAGPLDAEYLYKLESAAQKHGWFVKRTIAGDKTRHTYHPGAKSAQLLAAAEKYLGAGKAKMDFLLSWMEKFDTERAEIVATLFAAWSDLLRAGHAVTDDAIITEVRDNWHESKKRFEPDRLRIALGWMQEQHLVPTGTSASVA